MTVTNLHYELIYLRLYVYERDNFEQCLWEMSMRVGGKQSLSSLWRDYYQRLLQRLCGEAVYAVCVCKERSDEGCSG